MQWWLEIKWEMATVSSLSTLTLAHVDSVCWQTQDSCCFHHKKDLLTQMPEVSLLFCSLGLNSTIELLRFIDDPTVKSANAKKQWTLVDHNRAEEAFGVNHWEVAEMMNHHLTKCTPPIHSHTHMTQDSAETCCCC